MGTERNVEDGDFFLVADDASGPTTVRRVPLANAIAAVGGGVGPFDHTDITDFNAAVDARVATNIAFVAPVTGDYDSGTDTLTVGAATAVVSDDVDEVIEVTALEYGALTPAARTLYVISDAAAGGGANLTATLGATTIVVVSDSGTDATLPLADGTNAGLVPPAAASRIFGKKATGNVVALTGAEAGALIKLDEHAAPTDVTTLNATTSAHGLLPKLGGGTTNFLRADGTWNAPAGSGGANLTYTASASDGTVVSDTGTDATLPLADGTNAGLVPPLAASRIIGKKATGGIAALTGAEVGALVKLDELAAPTDVTTLNASTSAHGLLKKLSNTATQYMDGTGAWSTPAGTSTPTVPRHLISSVRLALPGVVFKDQASSAAQVASRMNYMPILPPSTIDIDAMYTEVVTVSGATVARMGIYLADTSWLPTTLVYDFGTVDPSTTGVKITTTHTITLTAGVAYLMAWVTDGTPVVRSIRGWFPGMGLDPGMGAGMIPQKFTKGGIGTGALAGTATVWDTVTTSTVGFEYPCMVRVTSV